MPQEEEDTEEVEELSGEGPVQLLGEPSEEEPSGPSSAGSAPSSAEPGAALQMEQAEAELQMEQPEVELQMADLEEAPELEWQVAAEDATSL